MSIHKKFISIFLILSFGVFWAGCADSAAQEDPDTIQIVLVGYANNQIGIDRFRKGLQLAIEEYSGPYTIELSVDDTAETADEAEIVMTRCAADPNITAIVCLYDHEVMSSVVNVMETHKKPFFAVEGYPQATLEAGYTSIIPFCLNAYHLGFAMALYGDQKGYESAGCLHSGTAFEMDVAASIDEAWAWDWTDLKTVSSISEPCSLSDMGTVFTAWDVLGVEVFFLPYAEPGWAADILNSYKASHADIDVIACFPFDHDDLYERIGDYEGIIFPEYYPVSDTEEVKAFRQRYQDAFNEPAQNQHIQAYDLIGIITQCYQGANEDFIDYLWEHHHELTGLAGEAIPLLLDGEFQFIDPYAEEEILFDYQFYTVRNGAFAGIGGL